MDMNVVLVDNLGNRQEFKSGDVVRVYTRVESDSSDVCWMEPEDVGDDWAECTIDALKASIVEQRRSERGVKPTRGPRYAKRFYVWCAPYIANPNKEDTYFYQLDVTRADLEDTE